MVNPQQNNCNYPFKGLSGTGVAYKLLQALDQTLTERVIGKKPATLGRI